MLGKKRVSVLIGLFLCLLAVLAQAGQQAGIDWLQSRTATDGHFENQAGIATDFQAASEALRALRTFDDDTVALESTLDYLNAQGYGSAENLSRRIIAGRLLNRNVSGLVVELAGTQGMDGGFGSAPGDASNSLDTAWALLAFHAAGFSGPVPAALQYLQNAQRADGAYGLNEQPDIYVTSHALRALSKYASQYPLSDNIKSSVAYLQAQRASGALWGGSTFLTALAYSAIHDFIPQDPTASDIKTLLLNTQSADGSWNKDPYITALALEALARTAEPPPDIDVGAISGQILDAATHEPLAGVVVTITGTTTRSAITDATGRYLVTAIPTGAVRIVTSLDGYLAVQVDGTVSSGNTLQFSPQLAHDPQPTAISLHGIVLDAQTSRPLANAHVIVFGTLYTATSDTRGQFVLNDIPPGNVQLQVQLVDYDSANLSVSAPSGGDADLGVIALRPSGSAPGATTGTIRGSIIDALSGLPLAGVRVSISGGDTVAAYTDTSGHYAFTGLPPGDIAITAALDGYDQALGQGSIIAGAVMVFDARLVKAANPALVTIAGTVVDASSQEPLQGATIAVAGASQTLTSGSDGTFALGGVPQSDQLVIRVSLAGYNDIIYTANAAGGLINLGTIALVLSAPISGNRSPIIASSAPPHATAGQIYAYNVRATDADGDGLTYALGDHPSGMAIDSASGRIRWVPTVAQAGQQSFTVVVFDTQGGRTTQAATVSVGTGGNATYVVTDVQTLSGLYVDKQVPANYTLGHYVSGANPGFVSAARACPLAWFNGGRDPASALNRLERLSGSISLAGQPSHGTDITFDLGSAYSTITVFPQIDHAPFPQEGIEYTVWGSNDPNATFPGGWHLATLLSIYRKGYVTSPGCGGQNETDDYAGLYTFGASDFRYLRVRSDYSITIFNTASHINWNGAGDDSGAPGWQSSEAEIDGAGGMNCPPTTAINAGADIVGTTGVPVQFDGSGAGANVITYGWDLDGDGVIDLTGPKPVYTFNTAVDRDVTLMTVDDRGCANVGNVHVTITLNVPKPDLTVINVNSAEVAADPYSLHVTGSIIATIANISPAAALQPTQVMVFEDRNGNGAYDADADHALGAATMPSGLAANGSLIMQVPINGEMLFPGGPLSVMVDSGRQLDEAREDNNTAATVESCQEAEGDAEADLDLVGLRVTGQAPASINVRAGNIGQMASAATTIDFYEGDPTASGRFLGSQSVAALQAGKYQDISLQGFGLTGTTDIYAVLDPQNVVPECRKDNNMAHSPVLKPPFTGTISVSTDRASYGANMDVHISASVSNNTSFDGTAQVRFSIETADGSTQVFALPLPAPVTVESNGSRSVPASWSTGVIYTGNYRAKAELLDENGQILGVAYALFSIVADNATVTGKVTTDKSRYAPFDIVSINDRLINITANALANNITAHTRVVNPSGSLRWSNTSTIAQLAPGALRDLTFGLPLGNAPPGAYTVQLEVVLDGTTASTSSATFTVESSAAAGAGLRGTLIVDPVEVPQQTSLGLHADIVNGGNAALGDMIGTITISDPETNDVLFRQSTLISALATGGQFQWLTNWNVAGTVGRTYPAALAATVGGKTVYLDFTNFTVLPPPIKIGGNLALGQHGRVLILTDDPAKYAADEDPFGPSPAPGLSLQRQYIQQVLDAAGWSYTIVTSAEDFEREFDTDGYEVYALFSEAVKLPQRLINRVDQAVYDGAGLVVAGNHDRRNNHIENALGLHSTGKNLDVAALTLDPSVLDLSGGQVNFSIDAQPLDVKSGDAAVVGRFTLTNGEMTPAVFTHPYGEGKAVYVAFDLALAGAASGNDSLFARLLMDSLSFAHPAKLAPYPHRVLPVVLTIQNEGIATPGRAVVTLPVSVAVIDSNGATVQPDGSLAWTFDLEKGEMLRLPFWVRMPDRPGVVTVSATVQSGRGPNYVDQASPNILINVQPRPAEQQ